MSCLKRNLFFVKTIDRKINPSTPVGTGATRLKVMPFIVKV